MSNGTPEPGEGSPEGPPSQLAMAALAYAVLWILVALTSLVLDWSAITSWAGLVWGSLVLLAASVLVLARVMGVLRFPRGRSGG